MIEQIWFPCGASYAEQALINGRRYVTYPAPGFKVGYGTGLMDSSGYWATREEARAACVGHAIATDGRLEFATECPQHWMPEPKSHA